MRLEDVTRFVLSFVIFYLIANVVLRGLGFPFVSPTTITVLSAWYSIIQAIRDRF